MTDLYQDSQPVNVLYKVRKPYIDKYPNRKVYLVGSGDIQVTCNADGNPDSNYIWRKEDNSTHSLSLNSSLIIDTMSINNSGIFVCYAFNNLSVNKYDRNETVDIEIVSSVSESAADKVHTTSAFVIGISVTACMVALAIGIVVFVYCRRKCRENKLKITEKNESEMCLVDVKGNNVNNDTTATPDLMSHEDKSKTDAKESSHSEIENKLQITVKNESETSLGAVKGNSVNNDTKATPDLISHEDKSKKTDAKESSHSETTHAAKQPAVNKTMQHRGLAVICYHSKFRLKGSDRHCAADDAYMMEKAWELYGCKVIKFKDKTSSFYKTEMRNEIERNIRTIPDFQLFVFVLSTHGKEERNDHTKTFEHYFSTHDGEFGTQDLITNIAEIEELKDKLKLFVIQACRSRSGDKDSAKEDPGYKVKCNKIVQVTRSVENNKDINTTDELTNDQDLTDSKGCGSRNEMSFPDVEPMPKDSTTGATMVSVPHCDDCIVLFASMPGQNAYRCDSSSFPGSWLIIALHAALINDHHTDKVHILDILTTVNSEVGEKDGNKRSTDESGITAQSCFFHNIAFDLEDLYLVKLPV